MEGEIGIATAKKNSVEALAWMTNSLKFWDGQVTTAIRNRNLLQERIVRERQHLAFLIKQPE